VDLIVVLVKSFHTEQAIAQAGPMLGEHTAVLSLQNGVGHEDILARAVGRERVLAGRSYVGGVLLEPGRIIAGVEGKETIIGELDGSLSERAERIADEFRRAGMMISVSDNILGTIWDKLLINVATGALAAITRLPYGPMYERPDLRETALVAAQEAIDVARASGVRLSITDPAQAWDKASAGLPYDFKASMLQSIEKGSVTEVDFVNGAVVAQGAKVHVPTPVNAALMACVKAIESTLPPAPQRG
jgi:2-dehydropantoate 2-reductase